jgi:hypothetical protein
MAAAIVETRLLGVRNYRRMFVIPSKSRSELEISSWHEERIEKVEVLLSDAEAL